MPQKYKISWRKDKKAVEAVEAVKAVKAVKGSPFEGGRGM